VQRAFTNVDSFSIFQDVLLGRTNGPQVNNVVQFGDLGELKVEARAVTDTKPLAGFEPRKGEGLIPFLGKSYVTPAKSPNTRVDFQFTRAGFVFGPIKFPYPVPFRLLNDEAKGWLDITYLSPRVRIARGNKGTLFVLKKEPTAVEILVAMIEEGQGESGEEVLAAIEALASGNRQSSADTLKFLEGEWKLKWTSQAASASGLQKFATGFDNFQVIGSSGKALDTLENVAKFLPFLVLRAKAECEQDAEDKTRFNVLIQGATLEVGSLEIPLNFIKGTGYLEVLYVDEDIRISKGSKGSMFVHTRSNLLQQ